MLNKLAATAVVAAAATGGILLAAAPAYADTNAGSNADTNANGTPVGADAGAAGGAKNSPGVISGNAIQVPIHLPAPLGGLDSHRPSRACIGGPAGAPACACGV